MALTQAAQYVGWAARLGLVALAVVGLWVDDATAVILAAFFFAVSLVVARIARPVLDACFAVVLAAHVCSVLLEPVKSIGAWGPVMHFVTPVLVALILALAAADGRLLGPPASPRAALATGLVGGLVVIVAWELLEVTLNRISVVHIHTERSDTMEDLALGVVGIGVGLALAAALLTHWRTREA
jgi:hypothetical protein